MIPFRAIPIPQAIADAVRETRVAPGYGHPAHTEAATDQAPCRVCLGTFLPGESRILFNHDAFAGVETLPLPGPVLVHEGACTPWSAPTGFPEALRQKPMTFNAYAAGRVLRAQAFVADGDAEPVIESLLARPDVDYLHVRHTTAGCYMFRIERA
jgi:hypothetical protein